MSAIENMWVLFRPRRQTGDLSLVKVLGYALTTTLGDTRTDHILVQDRQGHIELVAANELARGDWFIHEELALDEFESVHGHRET